jgi:hypothetical protein
MLNSVLGPLIHKENPETDDKKNPIFTLHRQNNQLKLKGILHTASLITTEHVIPAEAGIQKNTGFRVKPGMTNRLIFM